MYIYHGTNMLYIDLLNSTHYATILLFNSPINSMK